MQLLSITKSSSSSWVQAFSFSSSSLDFSRGLFLAQLTWPYRIPIYHGMPWSVLSFWRGHPVLECSSIQILEKEAPRRKEKNWRAWLYDMRRGTDIDVKRRTGDHDSTVLWSGEELEEDGGMWARGVSLSWQVSSRERGSRQRGPNKGTTAPGKRRTLFSAECTTVWRGVHWIMQPQTAFWDNCSTWRSITLESLLKFNYF